MADVKISAFPNAAALTGPELFAGVQSGANVAPTATQLKTFASASPTLVTPVLGVATATSINKLTFTAPATSATLTVADGKTLTANNSLTFAGTDATTMTFPASSDTVVTLGASQTLTGKTLTSPTLTTPTLGAATATSVNKITLTAPATSATLTIADGKTLTASNSLTLAGTDGQTMTFPSTSATIARTDAANTFTGVQTFNSVMKLSGDTTGAGSTVGFGTNSPASTLTGPYTWLKFTSSDGSTVYVPAYK